MSDRPKLKRGTELWVNSKWYADVLVADKNVVKLGFSARDAGGKRVLEVEVPADSIYLEGGTDRLQHVGIDEDVLKDKMGNNLDTIVRMGDITGVLESYEAEDVYTGYPSAVITEAYGFADKFRDGTPINRRELTFIALYGAKKGFNENLVAWARKRLCSVVLSEIDSGLQVREARPSNDLGRVSFEEFDNVVLESGLDPLTVALHIAYVNEDGAATANAGVAGMGAYASPGMPSAPGVADGTPGSDIAVTGTKSGLKSFSWQRLRDKGKELVDYRNSKKDMAKLKKMKKVNQIVGNNGMYNVIEGVNESTIEKVVAGLGVKWNELKGMTAREVTETKMAYRILTRMLKNESVSAGERKFLTAQAADLGKILGHVAVKLLPVPVPITPMLMFLEKKTGISFFPKDNRGHLSTNEDAGHVPPQYDPDDQEHYDALSDTGYFGKRAAGCVFVSKNTGRFMLVLRSAQVEQDGTWGNCGGAHKENEEPWKAAFREAKEETGYKGKIDLIPAYVYTDGDFRYSNFFAVVEDEFVPELGWEADDYRWCTLDDKPSPLHFGVSALIKDEDSRYFLEEMESRAKNNETANHMAINPLLKS